MRDAGLYVKGGGGMARSGIDYNNGSSSYETGFAWNVGAGYDIALSRAVGLGPMVDFYQGSFTRRNEPTLTEKLRGEGVGRISVACTHGLFTGRAVERLTVAGFDEIVATNTVPFKAD